MDAFCQTQSVPELPCCVCVQVCPLLSGGVAVYRCTEGHKHICIYVHIHVCAHTCNHPCLDAVFSIGFQGISPHNPVEFE